MNGSEEDKKEKEGSNLINEEHVGCTIPAPFPSDGIKLVEPSLDHFARSIAGKKAQHGAGTWAAVEPYCQSLCGLSRLDEPEE